jgi:predicted RNase H-like HicB family nuclease
MNAGSYDIADYYLAQPWGWKIARVDDPDGAYYEATIPEIPDFFVASRSAAELSADLRDAFLSHIRSYLSTGKIIPQPRGGQPTARARSSSMAVYAVAGG